MDNQEKDRFEIYLDEMIEKVQNCQQEHSVESCSQCPQYIGCELRKEYVNAVYNSMSKGDTGGFEF
ncbi:hypothetical protein [Sulfurimonas sp. C5]|uniref:hypothetical protein n=1 Tax=Sulfurimonas sp. C5 TaxID=3036947 RepID=UPI002458E974|nr:hypothetical protein [Sulfurimonas sp. C5]MDH4943919.1 hypothetical protein [Sulfurimonas sp. C5]